MGNGSGDEPKDPNNGDTDSDTEETTIEESNGGE